MSVVDRIWHGWLRQPYRLKTIFDTGRKVSQPVVFLHGLGRSSAVWKYVRQEGEGKALRLIGFDLLGFGESVKPDVRYDVDDHAKSVILSIKRLRLRKPVVLVGHSMGCLVAVRVARLRPDLVKHLILYEMPLYAGLPEKRLYKLRLQLYFSIYERIIAFKPIFSGPGRSQAQRLAEKIAGFKLNDDTWRPFIRSLKHTIMEQTTHQDIKELEMPLDIIYGTRDRLVFRGETKELFGEDATNITAHTIKENHRVSPSASKFLVERIVAATHSKHVR